MLRRRASLPKPATLAGRRRHEERSHGTDQAPASLFGSGNWSFSRSSLISPGAHHHPRAPPRPHPDDAHDDSADSWKLRRRRNARASPTQRLVVLALTVLLAATAFGWALLRLIENGLHPGIPAQTNAATDLIRTRLAQRTESGVATTDPAGVAAGRPVHVGPSNETEQAPISASFASDAFVGAGNASLQFTSSDLRAGLYPDQALDSSGRVASIPALSDAVAVAQTTAFVIPRGGPYTFVRHHHWPRGAAHEGFRVQSHPPFLTLPSDAYQPHMANADRPPYAPVVPLRDTFAYLRARSVPPISADAMAATVKTQNGSLPAETVPAKASGSPTGRSFDVGVAYILLCHDMDSVAGAGEFMEAVYTHPNLTRFFVHLDAKAGTDVLVALHSIVVKYPRDAAIIVYPRLRVDWGGVSMVKAELMALKAAENLWADWKFAVIASGTSFPIKSVCEREKWLESLDPRSNLVFYEDPWKVCHWGATSWDEHCKKQRGRCLDSDCTRMSHTPDSGVVYKGPQWVLLSREFSFYAVNSHNSRRWLEYFESGSHASDEMFFPTLLMNSPFRNTVSPSSKAPGSSAAPQGGATTSTMIYVFWNSWRRNGCRSYRSTAPWGWSPCLLGGNDFHDILRSDKQFARKFKAGDPVKERLRRLWLDTCKHDDTPGSLSAHPSSSSPSWHISKPSDAAPEVSDDFALPWTWEERAYQARNFVIWAFDLTRDWILGKIDKVLMPLDQALASERASASPTFSSEFEAASYGIPLASASP